MENGQNTPSGNKPGGFAELFSNRPLIVGLLFLSTYFAPFLILVGVPLAYVFRNRPEEKWEESHFTFLIRTFWIAILIAVLGGLSLVALDAAEPFLPGYLDESIFFVAIIGITAVLLMAFSGVRVIVSLMKSASHVPIANPRTWII